MEMKQYKLFLSHLVGMEEEAILFHEPVLIGIITGILWEGSYKYIEQSGYHC